MKKFFCICALLTTLGISASAQEWGYRSSIDLKYGTQQLTNMVSGQVYDSELALGLNINFKQFQLHRNPIANMIYLGIDSALSFDAAKYSTIEVGDNYQRGESLAEGLVTATILGNWEMMEAELGFHIGPYIKLAPLGALGQDGLRICAYYHYVPSVSVFALDRYGIAYNPFTAIGATIGWKCINVGYEIREGSAEYKTVTAKEFENYVKNNEQFDDIKTQSTHINGQRVFVRLSF